MRLTANPTKAARTAKRLLTIERASSYRYLARAEALYAGPICRRVISWHTDQEGLS